MSKISEARKILADVPVENAFYFNTAVDAFTGRCAQNLVSFRDHLKNVDIKSVQFHMSRGDFEKWVHFLGDNVLAIQISRLSKRGLTGENLRSRLYDAVNTRINELKGISKI